MWRGRRAKRQARWLNYFLPSHSLASRWKVYQKARRPRIKGVPFSLGWRLFGHFAKPLKSARAQGAEPDEVGILSLSIRWPCESDVPGRAGLAFGDPSV